jgi:hypothetical protein
MKRIVLGSLFLIAVVDVVEGVLVIRCLVGTTVVVIVDEVGVLRTSVLSGGFRVRPEFPFDKIAISAQLL